MTTFEKVFETLEATGTNWTAQKLPLISVCGKDTGSFGMFRSDNSQWLGTVKERYEPMQNSRLLELLVDATGMLNLDVTNGGVLRQGSKIYYQMQLQDEFVGKSAIKRHITAINSHDGSSSIAFGSTNTVVVCQNTFYKVHREMEKVKHTISADGRVEAMAANLKRTINSDILMMDDFKRMADLEMKDEIVERVIRNMFSIDPSKQQTEVSSRKFNQVNEFAGALKTEIELEGKTIWGLFNAVTRYTNHIAAPAEAEKKMDYLMNGAGAKASNTVFDDLVKWVDEHTQRYVNV